MRSSLPPTRLTDADRVGRADNIAAASASATAPAHFVLTTKRIGPPGRGTPFRLLADTVMATLSNPNGTARMRRDAFPETSVVSTDVVPVVPVNRFWSSTSTRVVSGIGVPAG